MSTTLAALRRTATRHAALLIIASLAIFATLAASIPQDDTMSGLDQGLAERIRDIAAPWLTDVFTVVTAAGDALTLLIVALAAAIVLAGLRRFADAALVLVASAGASALNVLVKHLVARPRPELDDPIAAAHGYAFPSGHAMIGLVVYAVVAYLAITTVRSRRIRITIVIATLTLVGLIGLSRLYLGLHFLSDVAGGYLLGMVWLLTCLIAVTRLRTPPWIKSSGDLIVHQHRERSLS